MTRFLIVDDHPLFREALHSALQLACPGAEADEATSIAGAVRQVEACKGAYDLALLDLTMPGTSGFEGLLEIRTRFPKLPVVVVSGLEDQRIVQQAMSYGIAGFIPKSSRKSDLANAITEVMKGAVYLPPGYSGETGSESSDDGMIQRLQSLTPQQLRVLQMLRQGLLNKQIAYELDVGETTVKAHVSEILRKLNVFSRTQAVIEVSRTDFDTILEGRAGKA